MEGVQDAVMIFNKYYFTTNLILIWVIETEVEGTLERPGLDPWIPQKTWLGIAYAHAVLALIIVPWSLPHLESLLVLENFSCPEFWHVLVIGLSSVWAIQSMHDVPSFQILSSLGKIYLSKKLFLSLLSLHHTGYVFY